MFYVGLMLSVFIVSWALTGALKRYAHQKNIFDVPNNRSSHLIATPHGGGVAIATTFLSAFFLVAFDENRPLYFVEVAGAGMLVALVGFVDDRRHVSVGWRLLIHLIASILVVHAFDGLPVLILFGMPLDMIWLTNVLVVLYLIWLLNLYNFMDGIDGIAAIETITVCIGGILLLLVAEPEGTAWHVPGLLLASVFGFLLWNFPYAKIFMGDVGSGFLGLILGVLSLQAAWVAAELFWSWMILLGVFLVDATVTLVRRILRKEKFYEAHCGHAYQYASRQFYSHVRISLSVGIINLVWLVPIALLVALNYLEGILGVIIAYSPLVLLAIYFKAGANVRSRN